MDLIWCLFDGQRRPRRKMQQSVTCEPLHVRNGIHVYIYLFALLARMCQPFERRHVLALLQCADPRRAWCRHAILVLRVGCQIELREFGASERA